jgi:DNA modification methylase
VSVRIIPGDCRDVLATLPADSVHCVVTSPPYWGLRDYGILDAGACPRCGGRFVRRPSPTVAATVLDCFGGSGTVGLVADRLKRNAVLIELNPSYVAMAERRIEDDAGMFAELNPS